PRTRNASNLPGALTGTTLAELHDRLQQLELHPGSTGWSERPGVTEIVRPGSLAKVGVMRASILTSPVVALPPGRGCTRRTGRGSPAPGPRPGPARRPPPPAAPRPAAGAGTRSSSGTARTRDDRGTGSRSRGRTPSGGRSRSAATIPPPPAS